MTRTRIGNGKELLVRLYVEILAGVLSFRYLGSHGANNGEIKGKGIK